MLPSNDEIIKELVKRITQVEQELKILRGQQIFPAIGVNGTLVSVALDTDAPGYNGYTTVVRFELASLTIPSHSITQMRVTINASVAEGLIITNAYLGHAAGSGNAYDFLATPVQLFWGGSPSKTIAAAGSAVSDWVLFPYNKTSPLVVSCYINGGAANDSFRVKSIANINSYVKIANESGSVVKSAGYTVNANSSLGVSLVESNGF